MRQFGPALWHWPSRGRIARADLGDNFSIVGYGTAGGGVTRVRSGSGGDFVCDPPPPPCNGCAHSPTCDGDVDGDGVIGIDDLIAMLGALGTTLGDPGYDGCADFDCDDAVGIGDLIAVLANFGNNCPPCTPDVATGDFVLHGRPVDMLPDGKTLVYIRARFYDPENGRWLQRDPSGYVDGGNLYESFRGNATAHTDPSGEEVWVEAQRRRAMGPAGQEVWAVDYTINESGVGLGLGDQLFLFYNYWFGSVPNSEVVERIPAGTEYFSYTEDWKQIKRMDVLIESQRLILEQGYIANRDVGNLRQGIIVLGTTAVALPASALRLRV